MTALEKFSEINGKEKIEAHYNAKIEIINHGDYIIITDASDWPNYGLPYTITFETFYYEDYKEIDISVFEAFNCIDEYNLIDKDLLFQSRVSEETATRIIDFIEEIKKVLGLEK